jgi:outer membrane protein OmpA-like peptidoglycan-associated protein
MKKFIILLLAVFALQNSFSQNNGVYIGAGYNFSHTALRGVNRFVDAYNSTSLHGSGFVMDAPMDYLKGISGHNIVVGYGIGDGLLEINWTRKFGSNIAQYTPFARREIGFKTRTLGLGYLHNIYSNPKLYLNIYAGGYMDFIKAKLLTKVSYSLQEAESLEWTELNIDNGRGNFSLVSPTMKFVFTPFGRIPISFAINTYWQMCWKNHDFTELDDNIPDNWNNFETRDSLKSSGGNIGVVFQILYTPNFRKPEKRIKDEYSDPISNDVKLSGKVLDEISNNAVPEAVIKIEKYENGNYVEIISMKAGTEGDFSLRIPRGVKYRISASSFGYTDKNEEIEINDYSPNDYEKDIKLGKYKVGQSIKLENIYFKKASAVLLDESFVELDKLYMFLKNNMGIEIEIAGHTSSEGDDNYNLKLSSDRAQAIVKYLTDKGIQAGRLSPVGYGEKFPVVDEKTEDDRKLNRRVEFKILKSN